MRVAGEVSNLSGEAIENARTYINATFGDKYLPEKPNFFSSSNKAAQEAHEAIRPTDAMRSPDKVSKHLKADEAKDVGLVNYIVPDADLHQAALEYCQKIATRSRPGIADMKRLAREGADLGIDQQMRLERDAAVRALPSVDVAEGLDAFENRRAPEFKA